MVHADSVGPPRVNLDVFKHESALGIRLCLSGAGQHSGTAGYQHQHGQVVREFSAFRAIDDLSVDIHGFLGQKWGLYRSDQIQRRRHKQ